MSSSDSLRIFHIAPEMLDEEYLEQQLYPDLTHSLYWSLDWDPDFYVALARAGFISIATTDAELGAVLLPELQEAYAVLDWENVHQSRNLRRLRRSGALEKEGIELRVVDDCQRVVEALLVYHAESTWLAPEYTGLLSSLPHDGNPHFALRGVELWATKPSRLEDEAESGDVEPGPRLLAGELGYTIGSTYTSLSGFSTRDEPRYGGYGTLQIVLLAEHWKAAGYAFWNMGHTAQAYKGDLGARNVPRDEFLERWLLARDVVPT